MKLIDLLEAIGEGYCSFDTAEIIQICEPNMDWDNFSEFHVGSQLLKPFVDFEVDCIGAIAENVIRVALYNEDFCGVKGYFPMPCKVGDTVEFGGLLGSAPLQPVHPFSAHDFVARGGRIPAPMQSLKN